MAELRKDWVAQECPRCGARLIIAPGATHFKCNYCDSSFERDPNVIVDYPNRKDFPGDKTAEERRTEMLKKSLEEARNEASKVKHDQGVIRDKTAKTILLIIFSPILFGIFLFFILVVIGMFMSMGDSGNTTKGYVDDYSYDSDTSHSNSSSELKEIDPFESMTITYNGTSGNAYIIVKDNKEYYGVGSARVSPNYDLKNGDVVTISVEYYPDTVKRYGYKLSRTSATITVSGLPHYVTDYDSLSEDVKSKLNTYALEKLVPENLTHQKNMKDDPRTPFEYCGWISRVEKSEKRGELYLVYKTNWTHNDTTKTIYTTAKFSNVIVDSNGNVTADWSPTVTSNYKTVKFESLIEVYGFDSIQRLKDEYITNGATDYNVKSDL